MSYLNDILTSYREAYPRAIPIARAVWLDGKYGWRAGMVPPYSKRIPLDAGVYRGCAAPQDNRGARYEQ